MVNTVLLEWISSSITEIVKFIPPPLSGIRLRLCCGVFKASSVEAIQAVMGEMPLHLRRDQLSLVYWANLRGNSEKLMSQTVLWECQERIK